MLKLRSAFAKAPSYSCRFFTSKAEPNVAILKKYQNFSAEGISALQNRLELKFDDPKILEKSLTHKSYDNEVENSNQNLQWLGKKVISLYAGEYLDARFPNLHTDFLQDVYQYYFGIQTLSQYAKNFGLQYLVRWNSPTEMSELKVGEKKVLGQAVQALVGAIYKDQGCEAAKGFIYKHFMSQRMDPTPLISFVQPLRELKALCKRKNLEPPISRLLKETGRYTAAPVFIVGMFSGTHKIGEGFGSSIKMAEFRSAKHALLNYYLKQEKALILPSVTENKGFDSEFTPAPLKDTPAYL